MKKVFLLGLALMLSLTGARADEGMWLPKLMKQQHPGGLAAQGRTATAARSFV